MPYNKDAIDALIKENKLSEAFEALQPVFQDEWIDKDVFEIVHDIVKAALEKGEITLAIQVAIYREGYFGFIPVPEEATWDTIIHAANKAGGFPEMSFQSIFLTPHVLGCAPSELNRLALEVYRLFNSKNWDIDGYKVQFDAYGCGPQFKKKPPILLRNVRIIRGNDFILGYGGIQGQIPGEWNLNNTAGFSFIAANGVVIKFYEDNSGPTVYEYCGDNWQEALSKIYGIHAFIDDKDPHWKEIDCRIPRQNEVYLDVLFSSNSMAEKKMSNYRKTGLATKAYYVNKVTTALQDLVLPKLKAVVMAASETTSVSSSKPASVVESMRRQHSPIFSTNATSLGQKRDINEVSEQAVSATKQCST